MWIFSHSFSIKAAFVIRPEYKRVLAHCFGFTVGRCTVLLSQLSSVSFRVAVSFRVEWRYQCTLPVTRLAASFGEQNAALKAQSVEFRRIYWLLPIFNLCFSFVYNHLKLRLCCCVFVTLEQTEPVLFHRFRHVAPLCCYSRPEQTIYICRVFFSSYPWGGWGVFRWLQSALLDATKSYTLELEVKKLWWIHNLLKKVMKKCEWNFSSACQKHNP